MTWIDRFSDATPDDEPVEVSPAHLREYQAKVLEARVFGAFLTAIEFRKDAEGLTQRTLAEGMGRSEDNVSKLLSGPRNWTLKTISDLAHALDLNFEFVLVDRAQPHHVFTETGMEDRSVPQVVEAVPSVATPVSLAVGFGGQNVVIVGTPTDCVREQLGQLAEMTTTLQAALNKATLKADVIPPYRPIAAFGQPATLAPASRVVVR